MGILVKTDNIICSISSIKLDKMKKRQIRKFLGTWISGIFTNINLNKFDDIVYVLILIAALLFPKAFNDYPFPKPNLIVRMNIL
jgi:hypothetical protein